MAPMSMPLGDLAGDEDLSAVRAVSADGSLAIRIRAILFPIFAIVAAGSLRRRHRPEMAVANRLNMDVFGRPWFSPPWPARPSNSPRWPLGPGRSCLASGLRSWPGPSPGCSAFRQRPVPPCCSITPAISACRFGAGMGRCRATGGGDPVHGRETFSLGARLLDPHASFLSLWRVPVVAAAMAGLDWWWPWADSFSRPDGRQDVGDVSVLCCFLASD